MNGASTAVRPCAPAVSIARWLIAAALALALAVALLVPSAAQASGNPLQLVSSQSLSDRLKELTFTTPSVPGQTKVRVLLPPQYNAPGDKKKKKKYPVVLALHGAGGNHTMWTLFGAEQIFANADVIVVMPDSGVSLGYMDWWKDLPAPGYDEGDPALAGYAPGAYKWETYHLKQLIPWIDKHYRTIDRREGRAVAGMSMGGFGALNYAARHPDMFVTAFSSSGVADTVWAGQNGLVPTNPAVGSVVEDQVRWRAVNPVDLAPNLKGLNVELHYGSGGQGPLDPEEPDPVLSAIEAAIAAMNFNLTAALTQAGVDHLNNYYGAGSHTPPYFVRAMTEALPRMMATFADPPSEPAKVTHKAVEPEYEVFDWKVEMFRGGTLEFSTLEDADENGFKLTGSGAARVTTPKNYHPRSWHLVRVIHGNGPGVPKLIRADSKGRLEIGMIISAPNEHDQFSPAEQEEPSTFKTVTVEID
jgi:S-formylglutathione hydrolase FrmB